MTHLVPPPPTRRFAVALFLIGLALGGTGAWATGTPANFLSGLGAVFVTGWILRRLLARAEGWRWFALPLVSIALAGLVFGLGVEIQRAMARQSNGPLDFAGLRILMRAAVALTYSLWLTYPFALLTHYLLRWFGLPAAATPATADLSGHATPAFLTRRRTLVVLALALVPGVGYVLRWWPRHAAPSSSTASRRRADALLQSASAQSAPKPTEPWTRNAPGRFFVDQQCIDCDLCRETAPKHFARDQIEGYAYVSAQPVTAREIALVKEAQEGCPVEAIFDREDAATREALQKSG